MVQAVFHALTTTAQSPPTKGSRIPRLGAHKKGPNARSFFGAPVFDSLGRGLPKPLPSSFGLLTIASVLFWCPCPRLTGEVSPDTPSVVLRTPNYCIGPFLVPGPSTLLDYRLILRDLMDLAMLIMWSAIRSALEESSRYCAPTEGVQIPFSMREICPSSILRV